MKKLAATFTATAVLVAAGVALLPALSPAAPVQVRQSVLANSAGLTLYTHDKDSLGKSLCVGGCSVQWPPLMATEDEKPEGDYGIITRPDGSLQWTYKNRPLYGYRADQKPGDQLGEGVGGVWKVAKP